ncbi:unnamed protein product [Ceutorhynchus assimilis]|uniref:protein-serine/threonine phosphatase n=1 Tax=Ceutorhynchus assimilis TaxID=467358 RepID=A0A9N9MF72_9CUCU|nr:unnamed protein product [Ceutorhynchus assimilis]
MGQTLSEPVTAKDTTVVRSSVFRVGSSCMQGWRINMEDSHTHLLSMPDDPDTAFFGVYDGHGGAKISDFAGKHLHKFMVNREEYRDGKIAEALKRAFLEFDQAMLEEESLKNEQSGSTAVVVVVKDKKLYCANIGDSRAIGCANGRLEKLSYDHKPNNLEEYERITDAGGWVDCNRVNGNLALSRAFGDYVFKRDSSRTAEEQIVIALPDVIEKELTPDWDFMVLACDGIWDVMSDEDVLAFVIEKIANGLEPEDICEGLMMRCLSPDCHMAGLGCDNMTVVIVVFLHGKPYQEVIEKCKSYMDDLKVLEKEQEPPSVPVAQESIKDLEKESNNIEEANKVKEINNIEEDTKIEEAANKPSKNTCPGRCLSKQKE